LVVTVDVSFYVSFTISYVILVSFISYTYYTYYTHYFRSLCSCYRVYGE